MTEPMTLKSAMLEGQQSIITTLRMAMNRQHERDPYTILTPLEVIGHLNVMEEMVREQMGEWS